ncbi:MAG: hypothetical protein WC791_04405 [Candidatus Paceibacterota bacterium]|jgi:hypothetical protein
MVQIIVGFFFSHWILIALCLIVVIWKADPEAVREYRRLKNLVWRANDGQADAEHMCEFEPHIKVANRWNKQFGYMRRYSVRRSALYACFGHY